MTIDTANSPFRFAIAATFTAEPLRPIIAFWSEQLNANFEVRFAPYNQLAQTLLDPAQRDRIEYAWREYCAGAYGGLGPVRRGGPDALGSSKRTFKRSCSRSALLRRS